MYILCTSYLNSLFCAGYYLNTSFCKNIQYIDQAVVWTIMRHKGLDTNTGETQDESKMRSVSRGGCFILRTSAAGERNRLQQTSVNVSTPFMNHGSHVIIIPSIAVHSFNRAKLLKVPLCILMPLCFKAHRGPSATSHNMSWKEEPQACRGSLWHYFHIRFCKVTCVHVLWHLYACICM